MVRQNVDLLWLWSAFGKIVDRQLVANSIR